MTPPPRPPTRGKTTLTKASLNRVKKVKNNVPWTYVISDRNGKEFVETFYEKQFQKLNKKDLRAEKVIKTKT